MKAGIFSIGLDTYWDQFDGLLDNLNGYHAEIRDRIAGMDVAADHAGRRAAVAVVPDPVAADFFGPGVDAGVVVVESNNHLRGDIDAVLPKCRNGLSVKLRVIELLFDPAQVGDVR